MFDWLKRLHGEGAVRAEFMCSDGTTGTAKQSYIGEYVESEIIQHIKDKILIDHDKIITSIKIVAHTEF